VKYLCLLYTDEARWEGLDDADRESIYGEYATLIGDLTQRGNYVTGAQLQPSSTATMVRVREGQTLVTDGPFAETKEQLGGFFLIEAKDADEAIEIASRIPSARDGSIEVRPIVERS
jgi:hypothetical protein